MRANAVAGHYALLTPEERFRLIVAAGARVDTAEQDRLAAAGRRLTLGVSDHFPFALAFNELALALFADLLAAAADYLEALHLADSLSPFADDEPSPGAESRGDESAGAEDGADRVTTWGQSLDLALALGYTLKAKGDGWKLFCERMGVPPFAAWDGWPGCDRLHRALALAEDLAFSPEGMVRWLQRLRPESGPEVTPLRLTPEAWAAGLEKLFRGCVQRCGGE
jgi:hypothetical protein